MITYDRSRTWQVAAAVLLVLAIGGGYWLFGSSGDAPSDGVKLADGQAGEGWIKPGVGQDGPVGSLGAPLEADGRPTDVQPEDWAALNAALAKQGQNKAEAERIVSFVRFQRHFEAWQTLDDTKDVKKRQSMARALLDEMPERMKTGEFTPMETAMISAVLVNGLEEDEAKRAVLMESWGTKLQIMSSMTEDEQAQKAQAREVELKRRMADAYATWMTRPVAERTPAVLEAAIADVRRAYNSGEF